MAGLDIPLIITLSLAGGILAGLIPLYINRRRHRRSRRFSPYRKIPATNRSQISSGTGGPGNEEYHPVISQQRINTVVSSEYALKEAINRVKNARLAAQAAIVKSDALMEVETNLSTASTPWANMLLPFQTTAWMTKPAEFSQVPEQLQEELVEAYIDMRLANDIVWLAKEVGRHSDVLDTSYVRLCNKIAERLITVLPSLKNAGI